MLFRLVSSNETHLVVVPPIHNVAYLQTKNQVRMRFIDILITFFIQFLFVADTPAKQAEFETLVQQNEGRTKYLFQLVINLFILIIIIICKMQFRKQHERLGFRDA